LSEFDEIAEMAGEGSRPEPNWEGSYECQWCETYVGEAYYDPAEKSLRWWCEKGHESRIEEFAL
jgi:hypothetical protein